MDTVLKPVVDNYSKYYVEKQRCPSYVQMYTKSDKEIVLVYNKIKQAFNPTDTYGQNNKNEAEELELTGSPLKLDLSLHTILDDTMISDEPQLYSKEENAHGPISIEIAREIANLYNKNRTLLSAEDAVPLWIVTNPDEEGKPLLLTVQSDMNHFARGLVTYDGSMNLDDVDLDQLVEDYARQEGLTADSVTSLVDCKYLISGISYGTSHNADELVNAPHNGITELRCEWTGNTLHTPFISCKVHFEQEVLVGHLATPTNAIWRSVCALHNLNQLLVDMTAAGYSSVNLETSAIRNNIPGTRQPNNAKRVNELLNETETYAYTAECPAGGCICVTEDTNSLGQCLTDMTSIGSSNDFTYKLWDILRDCETAEELITLLIQALKFISSGKIRPFIDANNKTYLSKLVLKLSRGHSQASKVLKNLRSSPPQALSLVAQVGTEKTMWEYTRIMSLLEHSFFIAGIWNNDARTHESIEQINQTIQDMTMSGGDFTLNPFESLTGAEHSIRLDCESFYDDDAHELTVDDFASLKKHGLVSEKKDVNEVPLITDEIDISPWKNLLMKFAQVHVCLEHLYRAENCLRTDFASLKPIASRLLEHYVSEKSPIRTVGQLVSDPLQKISMPIANNIVQDHLKKPAFWYRVEMTRKENASNKGILRDSKMVYVFSQQPVFPPSVWQYLEPPSEEVAEVTTIGEELKYHATKYMYISNKLVNKLPF
ncbi:zwilch kinetochore protein [Anticarsia gemmatalis]|uniref:zwilch kinetochore protein n=1 Tax=Anticarsia gemmatalis TaxID=129554 RepID=UPI003F76D035